MDSIISKVRDLVGDNYIFNNGSDVQTYFTSKVFTLAESNIDSNSLVIYKNGALFAGSGYYSYSNGKVIVSTTLIAGDVLEFDYNVYQKYSDNEIRGYIRAALTYLATEKYEVFTAKSDNEVFPTPTEAEENLMALIASIIMGGNISEYKTPEIDIRFNEKEDVEERITRVIRQFKKTFGTVRFIKTDRDIKIDKEDE